MADPYNPFSMFRTDEWKQQDLWEKWLQFQEVMPYHPKYMDFSPTDRAYLRNKALGYEDSDQLYRDLMERVKDADSTTRSRVFNQMMADDDRWQNQWSMDEKAKIREIGGLAIDPDEEYAPPGGGEIIASRQLGVPTLEDTKRALMNRFQRTRDFEQQQMAEQQKALQEDLFAGQLDAAQPGMGTAHQLLSKTPIIRNIYNPVTGFLGRIPGEAATTAATGMEFLAGGAGISPGGQASVEAIRNLMAPVTEPMYKFGREYGEAVAQSLPQRDVPRLEDVDGPGSALIYGLETVSEMGAFVASIALGGGVAGASGRIAALAIPSIAEVADEIYEQSGEYDPDLALPLGVAVMALENVGAEQILNSFTKPLQKKIKSTIVAYLLNAFKTAGVEGVTETAQELISIGAGRLSDEERELFEKLTQEERSRLVNAAAAGIIGGGGMSTIGGGYQEFLKPEEADYIKQLRESMSPEQIALLDSVMKQLTMTPEQRAEAQRRVDEVRAEAAAKEATREEMDRMEQVWRERVGLVQEEEPPSIPSALFEQPETGGAVVLDQYGQPVQTGAPLRTTLPERGDQELVRSAINKMNRSGKTLEAPETQATPEEIDAIQKEEAWEAAVKRLNPQDAADLLELGEISLTDGNSESGIWLEAHPDTEADTIVDRVKYLVAIGALADAKNAIDRYHYEMNKMDFEGDRAGEQRWMDASTQAVDLLRQAQTLETGEAQRAAETRAEAMPPPAQVERPARVPGTRQQAIEREAEERARQQRELVVTPEEAAQRPPTRIVDESGQVLEIPERPPEQAPAPRMRTEVDSAIEFMTENGLATEAEYLRRLRDGDDLSLDERAALEQGITAAAEAEPEISRIWERVKRQRLERPTQITNDQELEEWAVRHIEDGVTSPLELGLRLQEVNKHEVPVGKLRTLTKKLADQGLIEREVERGRVVLRPTAERQIATITDAQAATRRVWDAGRRAGIPNEVMFDLTDGIGEDGMTAREVAEQNPEVAAALENEEIAEMAFELERAAGRYADVHGTAVAPLFGPSGALVSGELTDDTVASEIDVGDTIEITDNVQDVIREQPETTNVGDRVQVVYAEEVEPGVTELQLNDGSWLRVEPITAIRRVIVPSRTIPESAGAIGGRRFAEMAIPELEARVLQLHQMLINSEALAQGDIYDYTYPIPTQGGLIAAKRTQRYQQDPEYRAKIDEAIQAVTDTMVEANRQRALLLGDPTGGKLGISMQEKSGKERAKYRQNVTRAWTAAAQNEYGERYLGNISVREVLQNSLDAVLEAIENGEIKQGKIEIITDQADNSSYGKSYEVKDNGIGMSDSDIAYKFLSLYDTGKDKVGRFGGFGVAKAVILMPSETANWTLRTRDNYLTDEMTNKEEEIGTLDKPIRGTHLTVETEEYIIDEDAVKYVEMTDFPSNVTATYNGQRLKNPFARMRPAQEIEEQVDSNTFLVARFYPKAPKGYERTQIVRLVDTVTGAKLCQGMEYLFGYEGAIVVDITTTATPGSGNYPLTKSRTKLEWNAGKAIKDKKEEITKNPFENIADLPKDKKYNITRIGDRAEWQRTIGAKDDDALYKRIMAEIQAIYEETGYFFGHGDANTPPITDLADMEIWIEEGYNGNRGRGIKHARHLAVYEAVLRLLAVKTGVEIDEFHAILDRMTYAHYGRNADGRRVTGLNPVLGLDRAMQGVYQYFTFIRDLAVHEMTHFYVMGHNEEFTSALGDIVGERMAELTPYIIRLAEVATGESAQITRTETVTETIEVVKEVVKTVEIEKLRREVVTALQLPLDLGGDFVKQEEEADGEAEQRPDEGVLGSDGPLYYPIGPIEAGEQQRLFGQRRILGDVAVDRTESTAPAGRGRRVADTSRAPERGRGGVPVGPVGGDRGVRGGEERGAARPDTRPAVLAPTEAELEAERTGTRRERMEAKAARYGRLLDAVETHEELDRVAEMWAQETPKPWWIKFEEQIKAKRKTITRPRRQEAAPATEARTRRLARRKAPETVPREGPTPTITDTTGRPLRGQERRESGETGPRRKIFTEEQRQRIRDAASREEAIELAEEFAGKLAIDSKTDLPNSNFFERDRTDAEEFIAIDLNNLKFANDTVSHTAGDMFLKAVADAMKRVAPDTSYRTGGDEFMIIAPKGQGAEIMRRLREEMPDTIQHDGHTIPTSISAGVGSTVDAADKAAIADKAAQKEAGLIVKSGKTPPGYLSPEGKKKPPKKKGKKRGKEKVQEEGRAALTDIQQRVMNAIEAGDRTITTIERRTGINRKAINRILRQLEKSGVIAIGIQPKEGGQERFYALLPGETVEGVTIADMAERDKAAKEEKKARKEAAEAAEESAFERVKREYEEPLTERERELEDREKSKQAGMLQIGTTNQEEQQIEEAVEAKHPWRRRKFKDWAVTGGTMSVEQQRAFDELVKGEQEAVIKWAQADRRLIDDNVRRLAKTRKDRYRMGRAMSEYLIGNITLDELKDTLEKDVPRDDKVFKDLEQKRLENSERHQILLNSGLLPKDVQAALEDNEFYLRMAYARFLTDKRLFGRWRRYKPTEVDKAIATDTVEAAFAKAIERVIKTVQKVSLELPREFDMAGFLEDTQHKDTEYMLEGMDPKQAEALKVLRDKVQEWGTAIRFQASLDGFGVSAVRLADETRQHAVNAINNLLDPRTPISSAGELKNVRNLERRVLSDVFKRLYGEIEDPGVLQALTVEAQGNLLAQANFFNEMLVAGEGAVWTRQANNAEGLTEKLGNRESQRDVFKYGALTGAYVTPEFKAFLDGTGQIHTSVNDLLSLGNPDGKKAAALMWAAYGNLQGTTRMMALMTMGAWWRNAISSVVTFALQSGDALHPTFFPKFYKAMTIAMRAWSGSERGMRQLARDMRAGAFHYTQASIVTDLKPAVGVTAQRLWEGSEPLMSTWRVAKNIPRKLKEFYILIDYAAKKAAWELRHEIALEKGLSEEVATQHAREHVEKYYQNANRVPKVIQQVGVLGLGDFLGFKYDSGRMAINALMNVWMSSTPGGRKTSAEGSRSAKFKGVANAHPELLDTWQPLIGFTMARAWPFAAFGLYGPGQYLLAFGSNVGAMAVKGSNLVQAIMNFFRPDDEEEEKKFEEVSPELEAAINEITEVYNANMPKWVVKYENPDGTKGVMMTPLGSQFGNAFEDWGLGHMQRLNRGGETLDEIVESNWRPENVVQMLPIGMAYQNIAEAITGFDPQTQFRQDNIIDAIRAYGRGEKEEAWDQLKGAFINFIADTSGGLGRSYKEAQVREQRAGRQPTIGTRLKEKEGETTGEIIYEIAKPMVRLLRMKEYNEAEVLRVLPYKLGSVTGKVQGSRLGARFYLKQEKKLGEYTNEELAQSKRAAENYVDGLRDAENRMNKMRPLFEYLEVDEESMISALLDDLPKGSGLTRDEAEAIVYGKVDEYLKSDKMFRVAEPGDEQVPGGPVPIEVEPTRRQAGEDIARSMLREDNFTHSDRIIAELKRRGYQIDEDEYYKKIYRWRKDIIQKGSRYNLYD